MSGLMVNFHQLVNIPGASSGALTYEKTKNERSKLRGIRPGRRGLIKILHLADFHASWCVSLSYIEKAIERGLQLKPDLICVTGDFITTRFEDFDGYCRVLSRLAQAAPVFA